jgi:hypothetical protein
MVQKDQIKISIDKMFDRMKQNHFTIHSPPTSLTDTTTTAPHSPSCWINSTSLGIFDGGSGNLTSGITDTTTKTPANPPLGNVVDLFNFSDFLKGEIKSSPSLSSRVEQMIVEHLAAITIGCAVGAAVMTGACVGIFATSGMLRVVPSLYQWVLSKRRRLQTRFNQIQDDSSNPLPREQSAGENSRTATATAVTNVSVIRAGSQGQFVLLKGTVQNDPASSSSLEQCRQSLDSVSALLSKQDMAWRDVKRLTAYLCTDRCEGTTFRQALSEYPLTVSSSIVSLMFVQRLEQESAVVEIEVLASQG